jgi:hypothetical protein
LLHTNLRLPGLLGRQDLVIDRGHCCVGQANVDRSRPLARLIPRFPSADLELNRDTLGQLLEFGPLQCGSVKEELVPFGVANEPKASLGRQTRHSAFYG